MFFAGILKVNVENSRIRIQDPDPNPDPLVRGMDPRIRIRIHPKMSWIRNTDRLFPRIYLLSPLHIINSTVGGYSYRVHKYLP
jgi:hypothetical protein